MGQEPEAGWAPDPYRRYEHRFWDGDQWTDHVLAHGQQKLDPIAFAVVPSDHEGPAVWAPAQVPAEVLGTEGGEEGGGALGVLATRAHVLLAVVTGGARALRTRTAHLGRNARRLVSLRSAAALVGLVCVGAGVAAIVRVAADDPIAAPLATAPAPQVMGSVTVSVSAEPTTTPGAPQEVARAASVTDGLLTGPTPSALVVGPTGGSTSPAGPGVTPSLTRGAVVTNPGGRPAGGTTGASTPPPTASAEPAPTTASEPAAEPEPDPEPDPEPKVYPNCRSLRVDYPHGVGLPGAVDEVRGSRTPVTDFFRDRPLYQANAARDQDDDGVACEA